MSIDHKRILLHRSQLVMAYSRDLPPREPVWIFPLGSHSKLVACPNCEPFRMGAIPNGDALLSTTRRYTAITSASPFRMGFTNAGYNHGSRYERVPPPCPGLLEGFLHLLSKSWNPETDTPPKTFRFHTKSHSKSEDFPFCDQMPLGVRFKRHCAR